MSVQHQMDCVIKMLIVPTQLVPVPVPVNLGLTEMAFFVLVGKVTFNINLIRL